MEEITSQKLTEILNPAAKVKNCVINEIVTDSRKAAAGTLFVAIKGENFDGHNFVKTAIDNGCELAVVERFVDGVNQNCQIKVNNTVEAYGKLGAYNRSRFKGKVIGLTGSAGKTTTKEEIKCALSVFAKTYATQGNHNNHIGVPQSLLEMPMDAQFAVIEMGMSSKGEIAALTRHVKPDIALITNVYPMHIEFFENFEGIAEAKAEIFEGLPPNGTAIINEDTNFAEVLEKRALEHNAKVVKFGSEHHYNGVLELKQDGEIQRYNAWAALEVVKALGLDQTKASSALKSFGALDGRGKKHLLPLHGGGTYTLIDDSYSGQPEAMKIAVKALDALPCQGRKIAVLGKMAELGNTSKAEHIAIGELLAKSKIDIVIGVKEEMKDMLKMLPPRITQYYFADKEGLAQFLQNKLLQNNDIVLIKGARYSSQLYKVTEVLLKG